MSKYLYIFIAIISFKLIASEALIYEGIVHSDNVDSLCLMNKKIISASFDGLIKETIGNESIVIGKHKDWVRKVICIDSNVITASNDGIITIWKDSKEVRSVNAHSWWITDIALSGNKLVSVSLDETVKVWSYPELKLLFTHKIYGSNKHFSVVINNGQAFIGSTFGRLSVLDIQSFKWLLKNKLIFTDYSIAISSVKSGEYIYFVTSDGYIVRMLASSPYKRLSKKISNVAITAIAENNGVLYVGDDNGVLRIINENDFNKIQVLNNYPEAIRALAIDNSFIYAGYDKGYIRIFNKEAKISVITKSNVMTNKIQ